MSTNTRVGVTLPLHGQKNLATTNAALRMINEQDAETDAALREAATAGAGDENLSDLLRRFCSS
jgi:hypothetical protein